MTKRYTGGVVSSSLPTVNSAGASGVFLLSQQADYQSRNSWPPFKVEESLRFRRSVSGHLNRTPAIASDRRTWTWSGWVKLGLLGVARQIFGTTANSNQSALVFEAGDTILIFSENASQTALRTTQLFRDPSAWYHVVWAEDTTQATASNRSKLYINGVQVTAFQYTQYPSQNFQGSINNNATHYISTYDGSTWAHDGYLAEVNFIDGQQLTPSSFGATDKDGNWSPIAYTGTYGNNGFYVNFRDNTSATTMGYDYSGNGNNWTLNNFNVSTANTSYDIMIDVPEDQSDGTANNRGNYCTFNPLDKDSNITTSNGNLAASTSTVDHNLIRSTIAIPSSGKFYAEMSFDQTMSGNPAAAFALISPSASLSAHIVSAGNYSVYGSSATVLSSGATSGASVTGMTSGQTWQIAVDADNNQAWVGLNNAWYNVYTSGATTGNPSTNTNPTFTGTMAGLFFGADFVNASGSINFGQRPFTYTPPSGFKALNTFNLPEPTIKQPNKQFDVVTYTGDGNSTKSITGVNFQPGFAWVKSRSNAQINVLGDVLRGMPNRTLRSDSTDTEQTFGGGNIQSLDSNGITVSYGSVGVNTNESGYTYVAWQWNAGTANTTNTSGSITSTVRVNQDAGFSVVTYTSPNNASDQTVGHGLFVKPSMIIVKNRDNTYNWDIYHSSLGYNSSLTFTTATTRSGAFGAEPTSTLFTTKNTYTHNSTDKYVAYCFAQVAGYSAFGSYTANGSTDGPFVYAGFRPRFVMTKKSSSTGAWAIVDTSINPNNQATTYLQPNTSGAVVGGTSSNGMDMLSNGFKIRSSDASFNETNGDTYIYMAFAEAPFKYARSR